MYQIRVITHIFKLQSTEIRLETSNAYSSKPKHCKLFILTKHVQEILETYARGRHSLLTRSRPFCSRPSDLRGIYDTSKLKGWKILP